MKLSERIKDMHERMTAPNIAELAVEGWIEEVAKLEADLQEHRAMFQVQQNAWETGRLELVRENEVLRANASKSVLRRLDAQLKESDI